MYFVLLHRPICSTSQTQELKELLYNSSSHSVRVKGLMRINFLAVDFSHMNLITCKVTNSFFTCCFAAGWLSGAIFVSSTGRLPTTRGTSSSLHTKCEPHVADKPADGTDDAAKLNEPASTSTDEPNNGSTDGSDDANGTS